MAELLERRDYTQEDLAQVLGMARSTVTNTLKLNSLAYDIKLECSTSNIESTLAHTASSDEARGRQEGTADAALHLFENVFESVPKDVEARILSADVADLLVWIDRITTAASLEDVFRDHPIVT